MFVKRLSEIRKVSSQLSKHAAPNALVWISYPKKGSAIASDLSRDILRENMAIMGWNTVAIVAIDENWSALRFRPLGKASSHPQQP